MATSKKICNIIKFTPRTNVSCGNRTDKSDFFHNGLKTDDYGVKQNINLSLLDLFYQQQ